MNRNIILTVAACLLLSSCYKGYVGDFERTACGFANQTDVRSLIVGESMQFSTGVALGGTISNEFDREVSYEIDYSLVNSSTLEAFRNHAFSYIPPLMEGITSLQVLPMECFNLRSGSNHPGRTIIRKGSHLGEIVVAVDSASFFTEDRLYPYSVIPVRITSAAKTEILAGRDYTVIGVRYESMLFGNYYHGGYMEREKDGVIEETVKYPTSIPQAEDRIWTLTTVAPRSLTSNAVGNGYNGQSAQMMLTLADDDSILVEAVPGATYEVEDEGGSRFIRTKLLQNRKIVLNYKYEADGYVYHVHDTLSFRNRIRDGVNEWQDENQKHYE